MVGLFFLIRQFSKVLFPFEQKIPKNKLREFRNVWNGLFVQQNLQLKCIHLNVVIENKWNTNPTWKCLSSNVVVVKVSSSSLLSSLARLHHLTSHFFSIEAVMLKCRFVFVFIDNSHSTPHLISFSSMCDTKCYYIVNYKISCECVSSFRYCIKHSLWDFGRWQHKIRSNRY